MNEAKAYPNVLSGDRTGTDGHGRARTKADLSPLVARGDGVQDLLPRLVALDSAEKIERFRIAAAWDGHANRIGTTHMLVRGDDIVGGSSLGNVAFANTWLHTEKLRPLETLRCANVMENALRLLGFEYVAINAPSDSPNFKNLRELFGYEFAGMHGLFVKKL